VRTVWTIHAAPVRRISGTPSAIAGLAGDHRCNLSCRHLDYDRSPSLDGIATFLASRGQRKKQRPGPSVRRLPCKSRNQIAVTRCFRQRDEIQVNKRIAAPATAKQARRFMFPACSSFAATSAGSGFLHFNTIERQIDIPIVHIYLVHADLVPRHISNVNLAVMGEETGFGFVLLTYTPCVCYARLSL
jgi:hypothetical protein